MYLGWRSRGSTASEWRGVVSGGKVLSSLICYTDCYTATLTAMTCGYHFFYGSKSYDNIAAAAVPSNI